MPYGPMESGSATDPARPVIGMFVDRHNPPTDEKG